MMPAKTQPSPRASFDGLIRLLRPRQWIKNGFVLAPLVFAGEFFNPASLTEALLATLIFCLGASATYIINDLRDAEEDRAHALKRHTRPLAAGQVSEGGAKVLLAGLYGLLIGAYFVMPEVALIVAGYHALNIAYTYYLKHQPVLDLFTVAIGFELRVYAGAAAIDVPVSSWMFITTLCLALYLAAVKRRQELVTSGGQGRRVLQHYSLPLINRYAEMSATAALVFYSLFVVTERPALVTTVPLVLYGLYRYWYAVEMLEQGESPTDALFNDWQLSLTVVFWLGACVWAIWGGP